MNKFTLPPALQKKVVASAILFFLFIVFAIIALLNPKWGKEYAATDYRRGLDTVFAIDISRSMDVHDVQIDGTRTTRLKRGLFLAKEGTKAAVGGRFAAALGRGRGYLSVPLTFDNEAVISFLENLETTAMTGRSTNLQSLIEASLEAFQSTSAARKVIVLISDGESHFGVLKNALNSCIREGVVIIAVGVGSDEGAQVPGIMQDSIPVSARDSSSLKMAAQSSGGIYIDGNRDDAASILRTQLISLAHETQGSPAPGIGKEDARKTEPKSRRGLFVILSIIAYAASKFIPRIGTGKRSARKAVAVLALVFSLCSCSKGKLLLIEANYLFSRGRFDEALIHYTEALDHGDAAPYAEYGLGITYYSMDINRTAMNHYYNSMQRASDNAEHRELRYRNSYNMGIIAFDQGLYDDAAVCFKEALKIDPSRIDAKRNLEISLMSIVRETQQERRPEVQSDIKEVMFEYVRQQEQPYWKSGEWQAEEVFSGPDY